MRLQFLVCCLLLGASAVVQADATDPTSDLAGSRDLPWLKRFAGSFIVAYDQKAYDEYVFPQGPLTRDADAEKRDGSNNSVWDFQPKLALEGARTRIVYVAPAGRSPLEVLRNYEQELVAEGAKKSFECSADACGGDPERNSEGGGGDQSVAMKLWPAARIAAANFTNASCAQTVHIADQRLASFELPERGYVVVHTFIGKDDLYCKPFNDRVIAIVDVMEIKAREQNMVVVSASDMQQAIASTGRVALYGIYFDTNSATLKPESDAALDQIAKLLGTEPGMKLHVVGHTDNQGGLPMNMDLSKRRAAAVREALVVQRGIDGDRLEANGVAYLAPVASNSDEGGRAKNRRVELVPF